MAAGAVSVALPLSISARAASTGAGDAVQAEPGASRAAARPGGAGPCASRRTHLRCPDLIMSAPRELHIDRVTIPGHVLLRATSSVDSRGSGPLELRVLRTGPHGTVVYQAIYDRRGRAHLFRTTAHLTYKFIPGERYGYGDVGGASYWKLRHAAAFELWSIGAHRRALRLVRRGPKVDYCLRDLTRTRPSRHSPAAAMYPACSEDPDMRRDVLGTSVGWSDVYPYSYPEQWINVTGLRGRFAYVQIADPDDHLLESSKHDNVSETYISLPSGDVLGTRVGVAAP
jgi:hypothetical protein